MKMKVRMKCNDEESLNEMTMKIKVWGVGGGGGFPPIQKKLLKIEMKMKVRRKCNDNESKNEMTIKMKMKLQ